MTKKIFWSIMLVAAGVLAANIVIVMGCLYEYYQGIQEKQLRDELHLAACAVESEGTAYLERLGHDTMPQIADYRFTWIAANGTVLYDTSVTADNMENHKDRTEVREALEKGESTKVRYSATLTEQTMYCAKALSDGTVLRVSISQLTVFSLALGMLQPMVIVGILTVVFSAVLARWMAKRILRPLNTLDLDHPLENDTYAEISPLLRRIHQQRQQITRQMRDLKERADEFLQISSHMNEGLVLLDSVGRVLSINPAARRIFGTDNGCMGQEFLLIDHSHELTTALDKAMKNGHGEALISRCGREYQLDLSRIESEGEPAGTVLLAFDVTERSAAERGRREFTANVSHELKTPLQSISGSAELLESGVVRQEDVPGFVGMIRTEAARLENLVEDIIRLSRLDEGVRLPEEPVDLYRIAKDVVSALQGQAAAKQVQLAVSGESAAVTGVGTYLYEMVYNLCDNAIKYNVEGGSVAITVAPSGSGAELTVRDTGIGIPREHQDRVFERFFRVDKSRSKASGGTGLGLSIVKHIAQYHHAAVSLSSRVGEGTTIRVAFPAKQS